MAENPVSLSPYFNLVLNLFTKVIYNFLDHSALAVGFLDSVHDI